MIHTTCGLHNKIQYWYLDVDDDGILTFPPELLKQTGWEEGDSLQWIDNEDGSFTLRKDEIKQDRTELGAR